jgi:monoamine oxidase
MAPDPSVDYDVVIVGAGAAGVAAARRLAGSDFSVLLLEAGDRPGGRAHTAVIEGMPLDLGCAWLHSAERNPWVEIAEAQGLAVFRRRAAWRRQYRDLGFSSSEQRAADESFEAWYKRLECSPPPSDRAADALTPEGPWNNYLQALSGYMNGAPLEGLSVADFLAYEQASSDNNWRMQSGYGALVAASLPSVPLRLSTPVTAVDHSGRVLRVETKNGAVRARAAILTVSTNVLASGVIRFDPALDDRLHAASCLPLGLADKLFLAVDEAAQLESETHVLGNPHRAETGSYYIKPFGMPVIECFFGGGGAMALEAAGPDETLAFATNELAALFGSNIRRLLKPLIGTAWGRTEWIGGSYSHALPGERARRAELAAPLENRLFFAGEATHPTDFSAAHGAYWSGVRAADEVMREL